MFFTDNIIEMNKNTCPFYIIFQVLKVASQLLLVKNYKTATRYFISFRFTLASQLVASQVAFTSSADIIFNKFLESNVIQHYISEKKIFITNFLYLTDSIQLQPPNSQNLLRKCDERKFFVVCQCSLCPQLRSSCYQKERETFLF